MATSAPNDWAVISRELAFRWATIKGVAADPTHIIASLPCPNAYSVPLVYLNLE